MKVKAFTLPELLVVLVIIGILVLLALPRLMPLITRTKSTEAQLQLKHLQTLEQSYFYLHSRYSDDIFLRSRQFQLKTIPPFQLKAQLKEKSQAKKYSKTEGLTLTARWGKLSLTNPKLYSSVIEATLN